MKIRVLKLIALCSVLLLVISFWGFGGLGTTIPAVHADTMYDTLSYKLPSTSNTKVNGLVDSTTPVPESTTYNQCFFTEPALSDAMGRPGYYQMKSCQDSSSYEEFHYDDNYIYSYADTTWDDYCHDPNNSAKLISAYYIPMAPPPPGEAWTNTTTYWQQHQDRIGLAIPRYMSIGATYTFNYIIVAFNSATGQVCESDNDSDAQYNGKSTPPSPVIPGWVKLDDVHPSMPFCTGCQTYYDVLELENANGEHSFYSKGYGWVSYFVNGKPKTNREAQRSYDLTQQVIPRQFPRPQGVATFYVHQNNAWIPQWFYDGQIGGQPNQNIDQIQIQIMSPIINPPQVTYATQSGNGNWTAWSSSNSQTLGTEGVPMTNIAIKLVNAPNYSIHYKVYVAGCGWRPLASDGAAANDGYCSGAIQQIMITTEGYLYPENTPTPTDAPVYTPPPATPRPSATPTPIPPTATPVPQHGNFQSWLLHTGTSVGMTDDNYQFLVGDWDHDGKPDLFGMIKRNTGSHKTEIHILSGASNYQQFILHTATAMNEIGLSDDANYHFALADWDHDGKPDLFIIMNNNTTNNTEIHVLSGASNYQTYILHTTTALHVTDNTYKLLIGDYDGDGKPDLYDIMKSNTGSQTTEVHILSGASNYQQYILHTATALGETGDNYDFVLGKWGGSSKPDLIAIKKYNTASQHTEVQILSGASNYQYFSLQTATLLEQATTSSYVFASGDYDRDRIDDLFIIEKYNTGSKTTEVHVLKG